MELGFETIGNATLIVHDRGPLLATDPWLGGEAYFGSWRLSHEVPDEQTAHVAEAPWLWISHGHPDHLHPGSLPRLRGHRILLPDHVGGRIASDLRRGGYDVTVLKDNRWLQLSEKVRVMCLSDYNQDGVLLVDIDGRLVANLNDSTDKGWGGRLRRIIRAYPTSFLLRLSGFGDADMINFFDEDGHRIPSGPELRKAAGYQVGAHVARTTDTFGARYFVPFSSFHRYQRTDSAWANSCTTSIEDWAAGYESKHSELLPPFIAYDCVTDTVRELGPNLTPASLAEPESFDDRWSDELEPGEVAEVATYFGEIEHLEDFLGFVNVRVGGRDNIVRLGTQHPDRGITFEVPRASLLQAVALRIFDDLLIGNFMRTTLHGSWPASKLSRDVTPYVAKYADNGGARSREEVEAYFREYRRRLGPVRYLRHAVERQARHAVQTRLRSEAGADFALRTYQRIIART